MTLEPFAAEWSASDVDAAALWAQCGGQWLTDPNVTVPVGLMRGVAGVVGWLDSAGAGLDGLFGGVGARVLTERAATQGFGAAGRVSCGGATRLLRGIDGWLAVSLARPDDFAALPALLGADVDDGDEWALVERALATLPVATTIERAGLLGIACSAVNEAVARPAVQVEALGASPPAAVGDLVVANLASLWAGPLAGDILARCGARVISIESTTRPDGARESPKFFADVHSRCQSVAVDFRTAVGRRQLAELLARVDVVIEGSRPRALEQVGIDACELTRSGPRLWLSITAHGRDAVQRHRIGFGDDAAAAGGLVGWVGDEPRFLADAVADPLTGLVGAAAVIQLATRGGRWLIDAPLAAIAAASATSTPSPPVRRDPSPPQRRRERGTLRPLGHDTLDVLAEFGVANS